MEKSENQSKSLRYVKISISIPTDLLIKVDLNKGKTGESRSGWIKKAVELRLSDARNNSIDELKRELNNLKGRIDFRKIKKAWVQPGLK